MLVLSRKSDESILIGDAIRVRVLAIRGGRVRLGVEAPAHVAIRRAELNPKRACLPRSLRTDGNQGAEVEHAA